MRPGGGEPICVHLAVLTIAPDPAGHDLALAKLVTERATAAGHRIVEQQTVTDTASTIRDQLASWIARPDIDLVIVTAVLESEHASAALAPLVTQPVPGFTDLFRWLAYQEIGASAMLSNAEAAQCGSTFVFVLPAGAGAVAAAMDKLILPQLDPATTPKNLLSAMPRLRGATGDAVPVAVVAEKTATGAGVAPKLPAERRHKPVTGANVIARRDTQVDDPPTRPIELSRLEQQIALSNESANEAVTRQIDLSTMLPRVPPGADEPDDDDLSFAPPAPRATRARPPTEPPSPRARRKPTAPPPPPPDLPAPVTDRGDDLPRGRFVYPPPRRRGWLVMAALLALAAAAGFVAVVHWFPDEAEPKTDPKTQPPPAPGQPSALEVTPLPEPARPQPSPPDIEIDPPATPPVAQAAPAHPPPAKLAPVVKPPAAQPVIAASTSDAAAPPAPEDAARSSSDCDEVSCVLAHYDQPCCQRYRPADSFKPRSETPDELDRGMVRAGVEKVKPKVIACGEKFPTKGTVKLSIVVGGDGAVREVSVQDAPEAELGACVAAAMRRAQFGTTVNGGTFTYPFVF